MSTTDSTIHDAPGVKPTPLRAFRSDPAIKAKYVARVIAHRAADDLVRGTGWEPYNGRGEDGEQRGKGCAIGCTLNGYEHTTYEAKLGIPAVLAYLEDHIFESLPEDRAMDWPLEFLEAIPVGADLSKVAAQICVWQYEDPEYGLMNTREVKDDRGLERVCLDLVALFRREMNGEAVATSEYAATGSRAWAGAWAQAGAQAGAWAQAGARARAGAGAGAWAGAWAQAGAPYLVFANKVLELLRNAPVPKV